MSMQLFSELTRIRGLLYHISLQVCQDGNDEKMAKLQQDIAKLEALPEETLSALQNILDEKKAELTSLGNMVPVTFDDIAKKLQIERSSLSGKSACAVFRRFRHIGLCQDAHLP